MRHQRQRHMSTNHSPTQIATSLYGLFEKTTSRESKPFFVPYVDGHLMA